jgi:hypothetical protein
MSGTIDELRDQLATAATPAVDAETRDHVETALALVDELSGPELLECPVYGRMGPPERIVDHDCETRSTR